MDNIDVLVPINYFWVNVFILANNAYIITLNNLLNLLQLDLCQFVITT